MADGEAMAVDDDERNEGAPAVPKQARLVLLAELVGHDGRVWGLDWSPEGDTLASCGADRTVRTWQCVGDGKSRGNEIRARRWAPDAVLEESQARAVRAVAWAPAPPPPLPAAPAASAAATRRLRSRRRRRRLAAASFDASVAVWEEERPPPPAAARNGVNIQGDDDDNGDDNDIDDENAENGDDDDEPTLWSQVALLQGHESEVKGVAWSPMPGAEEEEEEDAGSSSEEEGEGDTDNTSPVSPPPPPAAAAAAATTTTSSSSPKTLLGDGEGCLLATCGRDRSVWIWESVPCSSSSSSSSSSPSPCEFECVDVKQAHSGDVKAVAWHPSGSVLASASYDGTVRLWVPEGGASEAGVGGGGGGGGGAGGGYSNVTAAAADEWLCAQEVKGAHGGETVWSIVFEPRRRTRRRRRRKNENEIRGVRAASCGGDGRVSVWECPLPSGNATSSASASASAAPTERLSWRPGAVARSLAPPPLGGKVRPAYSVDWSRCGKWIASGGADDAVRVFAAPPPTPTSTTTSTTPEKGGTGEEGEGEDSRVLELVAEARPSTPCEINCVRWRPRRAKGEPPVLAAACDDGVVRLWKLVKE